MKRRSGGGVEEEEREKEERGKEEEEEEEEEEDLDGVEGGALVVVPEDLVREAQQPRLLLQVLLL